MASGYGLSGGTTSPMPLPLPTAHPINLSTNPPAYFPSIANTKLGPSRCFPFWQELLACYVVNTSTDDISGGKKCIPVMEDYYECLHHRKEVSVCFPELLFFSNGIWKMVEGWA